MMKQSNLKEGNEKNEIDFKDEDPDKELPDLIIQKINRKIRDGAKDYSKEWKNSIELTNWALNELNIYKPKISSPRWKQYMEFISSAVKEMYKARKRTGQWNV